MIISCKNEAQKPESQDELSVIGTYVSEDYQKRQEGYDWVAVIVNSDDLENIKIIVRSRTDKKKPTCTFNSDATKIDGGIYKTNYNGKNIIFQFTNDKVTISAENDNDSGLLYFFCSGGATLAGTYQKINEEIDGL